MIEPDNHENNNEPMIIITPGSEKEFVNDDDTELEESDNHSGSVRSQSVRFRVGPESPPIDRRRGDR